MRTLDSNLDTARSIGSSRADKKAASTKNNPFINFLIGLCAVIMLSFVVMELQTPIKHTDFTWNETFEIKPEVTIDKFIIEKPQPQVKPQNKLEPQVVKPVEKVSTIKPPVIVDNVDPEPIIDPEPTTVEPIVDKFNNSSDSPPVKSTTPAVVPSNYNLLAVSAVPLFPGCNARLDNKDRIECLNDKMARFVQRRFDTSLASEVKGKEMVSITVVFTIGIDGLPKDIQVKAPSKLLEKEAYRIIADLPKMIPGKYGDADVNTTYALPIHFRVQ